MARRGATGRVIGAAACWRAAPVIGDRPTCRRGLDTGLDRCDTGLDRRDAGLDRLDTGLDRAVGERGRSR